jgi:ribosomal protein S18 acetylase RimI-like enzyme
VKPLTPALEHEYLEYFDGPALADNPVWARCYCLSYHLDLPPREQDERTPEQNRADRAAQIRRGEASGVLAFSDGRVVGWCNASPRTALPHLDRRPEFACEDPEQTGAIVCYVIAPQYRGQGLARRLLEGACEMLGERGFAQVEAYPPKQPPTAAASYHGRLSMYLDAGFEPVRSGEHYVVVRKTL